MYISIDSAHDSNFHRQQVLTKGVLDHGALVERERNVNMAGIPYSKSLDYLIAHAKSFAEGEAVLTAARYVLSALEGFLALTDCELKESEKRAEAFYRLPEKPGKISWAWHRCAEGNPALRAAGHRQDNACQGTGV